MNARPPLAGISRPFRHGASALALAGTLVLAAGSLAACGGSPFNQGASDHACADKVAQAAVSGSVPGLWNCLSPSLQSTLEQSYGRSGDGALVQQPFATTSVFMGSSGDLAVYEQALTSSAAQQNGFSKQVLAVWVDSSGKVVGLSVGQSPN